MLPLVGWLGSRFGPAWRPRHRVALVWVAGLSYLGFILLLAWQALRGQPVAAPDGLTLWALLALAGAAVGVDLGVVLVARQDGIAGDRESGLLHSQE